MNLIEIFKGFIEGLALIVSPCILPVLPLVLGASADGGRRRPFGIIAGFIISFSLFALLSRSLVEVLHIDTNTIRTVSLWLLAFFGLVLVWPRLSDVFSRWTQGAANVGNKVQQSSGKDGFFSGVAIGALIGLIWTPCAGPILGVILVQVIQQHTNLEAVLVIVSFAIGAGLPMLAIALYGRSLLGKAKILTTHTEEIRRFLGVAIILSVAYIAFSADIEAKFSALRASRETTSAAPLALEHGLDKPYPAPAFVGLEGWINSKPLTMQELKGKVVLVDFWTYSCINCVRTLPYLTAWDAKYRDKGLVIVGVHAPEFEFEKNLDNVKAAVAARGIKYPVAQDNNLLTWQNFNNEYWPAHYLIDRSGKVVYTHFGEGKYDVTENNIRYLLGLGQQAEKTVPTGDVASTIGQTPETYLGYGRADHFSPDGGLKKDAVFEYKPAADLPLHHWTLAGRWQAGAEKTQALEAEATLRLHFKAKKVFLVMGAPEGKAVNVSVSLAGVPDKEVTVNHNTIYEIVTLPAVGEGTVDIKARDKGLEIYAFTFGS